VKPPIKFSQNFLRDPHVIKKLLAKTNINPNDTVYDIGGGKGIIADALSLVCHTVISVELDPKLVSTLQKNVQEHHNVLVYEADFLTLPLPQTPYKVFANIPFGLSADIVRKLCNTPQPPTTSYLIVQKEFGAKLAVQDNDRHSQQAILLGAQFEIRIIGHLKPSDFYPRPRVAAVLLELSLRPQPLIARKHHALFRDFVVHTYNAFQPTIAKTMLDIFTDQEFAHAAKSLEFPTNTTPTQLNLRQWIGLFNLAVQKYDLLVSLVGGQEEAYIRLHSKRTNLHRTRQDQP
jgi:23S rRNA (adenine-N6)-dimethyltransferase